MIPDQETAAAGDRARLELEQTEVAFTSLRQGILDLIAETSPAQPDKILKLHMAVQNLTAVKTALRGMVDSGLIARAALAQAGLT